MMMEIESLLIVRTMLDTTKFARDMRVLVGVEWISLICDIWLDRHMSLFLLVVFYCFDLIYVHIY